MDVNTVLLDLNVNRDLIDSKFECYRLSCEEIKVDSVHLQNKICELTLEDKQLFSFLHFSAFFREANYLIEDPFCLYDQNLCCYFVDQELDIYQVKKDTQDDAACSLKCLFSLKPQFDFQPASSDFLITLAFPTRHLVFILFSKSVNFGADGEELFMFVASTGDRQVGKEWQILEKIDLLDPNIFTDIYDHSSNEKPRAFTCPSKIVKSYSLSESNCEIIILSVMKNENDKFECFLSSINFERSENPLGTSKSRWTVQRILQLSSSSYPSYIGIDYQDEHQYLSIISETRFKFVFDSKKMEIQIIESVIEEEDDNMLLYTFIQSGEEITVDFKLSKDLEARHVAVEFEPSKLSINVRGERVFSEDLWGIIDKTSSSWTLESSKSKESPENISMLQITLMKRDEDMVWNQLIKGQEKGIELVTNDMDQSIFDRISFLATGIDSTLLKGPRYVPSLRDYEQCDQAPEDLAYSRYDCDRRRITHQINLGGHQWLFYRTVTDTSFPSFAVRHDIDALIWQPLINEENLTIDHIATFSALGYVQASKVTKKFLNCSPDFGYAFIADSNNHIYVYKQPELNPTLKNRKVGGIPKIGKQKVINLGREPERVLGALAFTDHLFILTTEKVFCLNVTF